MRQPELSGYLIKVNVRESMERGFGERVDWRDTNLLQWKPRLSSSALPSVRQILVWQHRVEVS